MRKLIKLLLLPISLWTACNTKNTETGPVPGTYINHAESAYSAADDTLIISPRSGNSYTVTRRTGFRRTGGTARYHNKTFTGLWDKGKLQLTGNGIILLFGQGQLQVQNSQYRKL